MVASPSKTQPRRPTQSNFTRARELAALACPYCCQHLDVSSTRAPVQAGFRVERSAGPLAASDCPLMGVCRRCRVVFHDTAAQLSLHKQVRERVLFAIYRTRRARDMFDRRRGDVSEAISELAEAFAWLEGQPGVRPFSAQQLHAWACQTERTAAERDAVAFLLHVHDATARYLLRFDVVSAMERWSPAERAVFVEWAQCPWWA